MQVTFWSYNPLFDTLALFAIFVAYTFENSHVHLGYNYSKQLRHINFDNW